MFHIIERKLEIDAYDPNKKILEDIHGEIHLKDVFSAIQPDLRS